MDNNIAIKCEKLTKKYPIYKGSFQRIKGLFLQDYQPEVFEALKEIDLVVKKGEILGIVGLNGSGKSTLSTIVAGISYPTSGECVVRGETSMLAVNAGIDNYLTGRENIYYKGVLLGLEERRIKEIEQDIIEFADIGIYIDQQVRTYSSGMRSRLGFSISVYMDPNILIVDEALSVGDNSFADKSLEKFMEFKEKGKTILFVSHAVTQMNSFCDKVLWLHRGEIVGLTEPDNLIKPYCGFAREINSMTKDEQMNLKPVLKIYQDKYL